MSTVHGAGRVFGAAPQERFLWKGERGIAHVIHFWNQRRRCTLHGMGAENVRQKCRARAVSRRGIISTLFKRVLIFY